MQRERWIVLGVLTSLALVADICIEWLPKASFDRGGVPVSDRSLLLVSENSQYMRKER